LEQGQNPKRLLVIMYNKSAQLDFSKKLRGVMQGPMPQVRTFHSLGLKNLSRAGATRLVSAF